MVITLLVCMMYTVDNILDKKIHSVKSYPQFAKIPKMILITSTKEVLCS